MKATFQHKVITAKAWLNNVKYGIGEEGEYKVIKTITLPKAEFEEFAGGLLTDQDFIQEYTDKNIIDENGVWHCIKITCKDKSIKYSILVCSQGYSYARYTAIINK